MHNEQYPDEIYLIDMGDEISWCDTPDPSQGLDRYESSTRYVRADTLTQQPESKPAWWEVEDMNGVKFTLRDKDDADEEAEFHRTGSPIALFKSPQPSAQVEAEAVERFWEYLQDQGVVSKTAPSMVYDEYMLALQDCDPVDDVDSYGLWSPRVRQAIKEAFFAGREAGCAAQVPEGLANAAAQYMRTADKYIQQAGIRDEPEYDQAYLDLADVIQAAPSIAEERDLKVLQLAWYHKFSGGDDGEDDYEIFDFKSEECGECVEVAIVRMDHSDAPYTGGE